MRLRPFALSVVACGLAAIGAEAACVTNATDAPLFFTIDARSGGARVAAPVAPGAQLCLSETSGAVLRVFASQQELEGCSRLVGRDGRDAVIAFHRYDNCRWASHGE